MQTEIPISAPVRTWAIHLQAHGNWKLVPLKNLGPLEFGISAKNARFGHRPLSRCASRRLQTWRAHCSSWVWGYYHEIAGRQLILRYERKTILHAVVDRLSLGPVPPEQLDQFEAGIKSNFVADPVDVRFDCTFSDSEGIADVAVPSTSLHKDS